MLRPARGAGGRACVSPVKDLSINCTGKNRFGTEGSAYVASTVPGFTATSIRYLDPVSSLMVRVWPKRVPSTLKKTGPSLGWILREMEMLMIGGTSSMMLLSPGGGGGAKWCWGGSPASGKDFQNKSPVWGDVSGVQNDSFDNVVYCSLFPLTAFIYLQIKRRNESNKCNHPKGSKVKLTSCSFSCLRFCSCWSIKVWPRSDTISEPAHKTTPFFFFFDHIEKNI